MSADEAAATYRPCVAVVLFAPDGRVLVGERVDIARPSWQLPQGGIDDGETPVEAAQRELHEEIGTDRAAVLAEGESWHCYDLPAGNDAPWRGRFRGQRVRLVAMRFTGGDADIRVATAYPEFRAWKWVPLEALPGLAVAFKRPLYEAAVQTFAPLRDRLIDRAR